MNFGHHSKHIQHPIIFGRIMFYFWMFTTSMSLGPKMRNYKVKQSNNYIKNRAQHLNTEIFYKKNNTEKYKHKLKKNINKL